MQAARWLVGTYGDTHGVCITSADVLANFESHVQGRHERMAIDLIRQTCPAIPVPEVYRTWESTWSDGVTTGYVAISYIPGMMLRDAWPSLTQESHERVLPRLRDIL